MSRRCALSICSYGSAWQSRPRRRWWSLARANLDEAVDTLFVEVVMALALEVALPVQEEVQSHLA